MITETVIATKKPKGFRTLAVSSTAVALSAATGGVPKFATRAVISVETNTIRWRDDGTAPTATVGMPVAAGGVIELPSLESITNFKAIRATADGALNISYYGE